MELDITFDPENPDNKIKEGKVQILVQSVTEGEKWTDIDYEVVAAEDPNELGKTNRERLFKSEKAMVRFATFAVAVGLTTWEKLTAAKKAGAAKARIEFQDAVGKSCFAELKKEDKYIRVTWNGFHHLSDPSCADWPRSKIDLAARQQQAAEALQF